MKKYYYIPVNSLSFNNILSSESISPLSFYERRCFGFRRFEKINASPFLNSIIAYDKVPKLPDIRSEREEYPFFVAIPEKYFDKNIFRKKHEDVEIIQIDCSIYLNWKECFFFSRTEDEKKKLIASTRRSIEVKNAEYYTSNIFVLDDYEIELFDWDETVLDSITDYKVSNQEQILRDQKVNKIKGFIYAYTSGKLKEQPTEMAEGNRYFQDFINSYSVLMNDLSVVSRENKSKGSRLNYSPIKKEINHLIDIKEKIEFLFSSYEKSEIDDLLKKSFGISNLQIDNFKRLNYENTRVSVYSLISDFIKKKEQTLYSIDELLNKLIDNVNSFLKNSSPNLYKNLENDFNSFRIIINNKINDYRKNTIRENSFENIPFNFNIELSKLTSGLDEIGKKENESYSLIINEFLSRIELSTSDEIGQNRMDILKTIGGEILKTTDGDEKVKNYLTKLWKSLKTVGVGFKISESDDNALKSLACFLSKHSEMEKLQDFMDKNKYYNYGLSFGIWGAAYGYANTSKILIESLNSNKETLDLITKYTNELILQEEINEDSIDIFFSSLKKKISKSNSGRWNFKSKIDSKKHEEGHKKPKELILEDETSKVFDLKINSAISKENSLFENKDNSDIYLFVDLIKGEIDFTKRPDWLISIEKCYKETIRIFESETKLFSNMGLSSKKQTFSDSLKKEKEQGNLERFGPQKIKQTIKIFTEHIHSNE